MYFLYYKSNVRLRYIFIFITSYFQSFSLRSFIKRKSRKIILKYNVQVAVIHNCNVTYMCNNNSTYVFQTQVDYHLNI